MFSNQDVKLGVIAQTSANTVPTSGNLLSVDFTEGSLQFSKTSERVASNTQKPNRAKATDRRGKSMVAFSFKFRIHSDDAFELMLTSLLGKKAWTEIAPTGDVNDTLVSGSDTVPLMFVLQYVDENNVLNRDNVIGAQINKLTFSAENSAGLEATVEGVAIDIIEGVTATQTLTPVAASTTLELVGDEVGVTVSGVSLSDYTKLDLSIEMPRAGKYVLGSTLAKNNIVTSARNISGSLTYIKPTGATPAFTGNAQALTMTLGSAYTVVLPAVTVMLPENDYSGDTIDAKADFSAGYDNTAATDVIVTRL